MPKACFYKVWPKIIFYKEWLRSILNKIPKRWVFDKVSKTCFYKEWSRSALYKNNDLDIQQILKLPESKILQRLYTLYEESSWKPKYSSLIKVKSPKSRRVRRRLVMNKLWHLMTGVFYAWVWQTLVIKITPHVMMTHLPRGSNYLYKG